MDEDIDVDLLISLVKANPPIWDKSLEDYKCDQTALAWKNVFCRLNEVFENLDGKEKNEFGKLLIYLLFTDSLPNVIIVNEAIQ